MKINLFFLFISFFYIITTDTYYESTITLYPAGELHESFDLFDQYETLSEAFGLNLDAKSNYYIPDIIVSNSLKREIVFNKWNTEKYKYPVDLIEYWKINENNIFDKIQSLFNSKYYDKKIDDINNAILNLNNLITVDEKNSGLVEVTVNMQEPKLAADIANYISTYVVKFVSAQQKSFASKNKNFVQERLNIAEEELFKSENILKNFRMNNPSSLDNPDLQLQRLQLIRNVEINQGVLVTLRNQYEIAKLEESKERLFINILDPAQVSVVKSHPKTFMILILTLIFGYIISFLLLITYHNIKFSFNSQNE